MILQQALNLAAQALAANSDIENPVFESEVLLRNILKIDRARLLLDKQNSLSLENELVFRQWVQRRLEGEPTAYIINNREFYGLDFYVDRRVLIPRPETELIVEEALKYVSSHPLAAVADIGTGSGVIAVSLAVNLPNAKNKIYATDVSVDALEVARINCQKHQVAEQISLILGDLLDPLPEPVDLLIANLPYVNTSALALIPSARFEPILALDGGETGLSQIARFCRQIKGKINPGGRLILEIGLGQVPAVKDCLQAIVMDSAIDLIPDLAGIERVIKLDIPG